MIERVTIETSFVSYLSARPSRDLIVSWLLRDCRPVNCLACAEMPMARHMTPAEQQRFRGYFPNLNVNQAVVTDNATWAYNCIAWTVGLTNRWIWPGGALAHFDAFHRGYGFARSGNGRIAAWGHSTSAMTHGSISGPGHGPRWESKCGPDLRIQHGLNELTGGQYGRVLAFYTRGRTLPVPLAAAAEAIMKERLAKSYLSVAQKHLLHSQLAEAPAKVRAAFETAFSAWKDNWFSGGLASISTRIFPL